MSAAERPRWRQGQALPERTLAPIEREELVRYADASGDRDPVHTDDDAAREAGLPGIVQQGALTMARIGLLFSPFLDHGLIRSFTGRFVGNPGPGDRLVVGGTVVRSEPARDGELFTFDVYARTDAGRPVAYGSVEFLLWGAPDE